VTPGLLFAVRKNDKPIGPGFTITPHWLDFQEILHTR
jgi:hypothetical protein